MQPFYKDPAQGVQARLDDLISRMTPEEKIGQLMMLDGRGTLDTILTKGTGAFLHIFGEEVNRAIDINTQTRLQIPLFIAEDCIHGHSFWKGSTIFPTQLAMACSWNPDLLTEAARVVAREVRPTGIQWTFSPVLCLTRDLRWGRVGETFGEDPHLIGELATAMIKGYQGKGLDDPENILATAKHYAGYSETQGGRDASEADISHRKLRSYFLPPFEKAARSNCMTFMIGYQSMEGIPSTANTWLIRDVLKKEWKYKGILVTDWDNVGRLVHEQKVCANIRDAATLAIKSGNDLMMQTPTFFDGAVQAYKEGLIQDVDLNEPCRRIIGLKLRMGLFEDPRRADLEQAAIVVTRKDHEATNLEVARQSAVLLSNADALPLKPGLRRIAVVGPNADNDLDQLGDWSLGSCQHNKDLGKHPRERTVTVLDGIRSLAPKDCEIVYEKACNVIDKDLSGLEKAVEAVRSADLAIVVIGDQLPFIGETLSTATLELQGGQLALVEELGKLGKPLVFVLICSKPLVLPPVVQQAAAVICAFNPGMQGGRAVAEIIFGEVNPSGKLPVSFPYHVGQQPIYYSQVRGQHGNRYADLTQEPLFAFGYGMSYTSFAYSSPRNLTPSLLKNKSAKIEIDVTNTGLRAGYDVVQVYVEDEVTSATWVQKELKAFKKIFLKPGETKKVSFVIPYRAFSIVNAKGKRVVETGDFQIHVGNSSRPQDLQSVKVSVLP